MEIVHNKLFFKKNIKGKVNKIGPLDLKNKIHGKESEINEATL